MGTLTKPRPGWTRKIGRVLLHANWSRSWDGWARKGPHGAIHWMPLSVEPFKHPVAGYYGVSIHLLWLLVRIGVAAPAGGAQENADG